MVACFISDDNCWYRATIVSADLNAETVTNEDFFSVKLVDFGDTIVTDKHCLASLLPEFLNIRFQAIECTLHGIEPTRYEILILNFDFELKRLKRLVEIQWKFKLDGRNGRSIRKLDVLYAMENFDGKNRVSCTTRWTLDPFSETRRYELN